MQAISRFVFAAIFLIAGAATTPAGLAQTSQTSPAPTPIPPLVPQTSANSNQLAVVVLDPAHGGTDTGARGASGIVESDIVFGYAQLMQAALQELGFQVILTRQANQDPAFDDRSQLANSQKGAIFISIHVASTGPPGTVRVYSFPQAPPQPLSPDQTSQSGPAPTNLIPWDQAQQAYVAISQKLAALLQAQMAQRFPGSPQTPDIAAVRQLRSVAAPAVAIEVSSVSVPDGSLLDRMGHGLAEGVASAVAAFRPIYQAEAK